MSQAPRSNLARFARAAVVIAVSILLCWLAFFVPLFVDWIQGSEIILLDALIWSSVVMGVNYGLFVAALYFILRLLFALILRVIRR